MSPHEACPGGWIFSFGYCFCPVAATYVVLVIMVHFFPLKPWIIKVTRLKCLSECDDLGLRYYTESISVSLMLH